jgi:hypothetical protein
MERNWIRAEISRMMTGESSGALELMPAVTLSTESTRERRAASPPESVWTSFLFTFSEKEAVVRVDLR